MTLHSWHSTANRLNVLYIPGYRATSVPFLTLPLAITTPTPAPGTLLCARIIQNPRTDSATWYDTKQFKQWVIMSPLATETERYRSASALCSRCYFPGQTMNTIKKNEEAIVVTSNCDLNYVQCTINPLWQTSTECYLEEKNQRVWNKKKCSNPTLNSTSSTVLGLNLGLCCQKWTKYLDYDNY